MFLVYAFLNLIIVRMFSGVLISDIGDIEV